MDGPLLAFLPKLPLALLVFVVVAYAGTTSKRIAGVLFTFPILNGIAIIASADPVRVADAIYPLVIFNCVLFAALLTFPGALPPLGVLPRWSRLFVRIVAWTLAWLAGAAIITDFRDAIFPAGVLLAGAAAFAFVFMSICWSGNANSPPAPRNHAVRFIAFWATTTGAWRVAFFVITYSCVFFAARFTSDPKWIGMASALPLPGLFALAALIDEREGNAATPLRPIRDTLFLGPVLVIPFNWVFSHALLALPQDAVVLRYLLLFALWTIAAVAVLILIPRIAAGFDRRSR